MSHPRIRTRGFTGCYTCRERKLKCDDAKPACNRCLAVGIKCQGYGVKLSWLSYNETAERKGLHVSCSESVAVEEAQSRRPLYTGKTPSLIKSAAMN